MKRPHSIRLFAAALIAVGCGDPLGPEFPGPDDARFFHGQTGGGVHGSGSTGSGPASPGSSRQDFTFDVARDLSGSLTYRDWSVVRTDGTVATVTVAANDGGTWFASYRDASTACADPSRGAEVDGMGRLDTGELVWFSVAACDVSPGGTGSDIFRMSVPDAAGYERHGLLTSGDIVKSGGTAPPAAAISGISGLGAIGAGAPTPGSDRQEFTFDVTGAGGSITFSDYGVVRNGVPGRIIADPSADPPTGISSYHQVSGTCVRFSGTGRLDTGQLWPFYVDACDVARPGVGFDSFSITLPDRVASGVPYSRSGTLTAGDIVSSGTVPAVQGTLASPTF